MGLNLSGGRGWRLDQKKGGRSMRNTRELNPGVETRAGFGKELVQDVSTQMRQ